MLNTLSMAMMYSTWLNRSNDEKYNNSTITAPKKKKRIHVGKVVCYHYTTGAVSIESDTRQNQILRTGIEPVAQPIYSLLVPLIYYTKLWPSLSVHNTKTFLSQYSPNRVSCGVRRLRVERERESVCVCVRERLMSTESTPLIERVGGIAEGEDERRRLRNDAPAAGPEIHTLRNRSLSGSGSGSGSGGERVSSGMSLGIDGSSVFHRLLRQKSEQDIVSEVEEEHAAAARSSAANGSNGGNSNGTTGTGDELVMKRTLTLFQVVCFGIGTTVGAGLFVTTGKAARELAGPAVTLSFMVASLATLASGLCYAELAARIPVSGSAYSYAYATLGEGVAWFIGWNLTLEYGVSSSAIARAWSAYVAAFFRSVGWHFPSWLDEFETGLALAPTVSLLSGVIIAVCTFGLLLGAEESSRFNVAITIVNLVLIGFIVVCGGVFVDVNNWFPLMPFGVRGVMAGAGFVFFSYIGFDSVCSLAEELRNPQRDLPIGIIVSLAVVTLLYVSVSIVVTGMVPYTSLSLTAPLSVAFNQVGQHWAGIIVAFGSTTTLAAATFCTLYGQPRIFYRMAKDGLLHSRFAKLNPQTRVPSFGIVFTGVMAAALAVLVDLVTLADMISIGTLLAFSVVCLGVLIIRKREMKAKRRSTTLVFSLNIAAFTVLSLLLNIGMVQGWSTAFLVLLAAAVLATVVWMYVLLSKQGDTDADADAEPMIAAAAAGAANRSPVQSLLTSSKTFMTPFVPLVPCIGVFANFHLIASLPMAAILRLIVWTAVGFAIYFGYGITNSKLEKNKQ